MLFPPLLILVGVLIGRASSLSLVGVLLIYMTMSFGYSWRFKSSPLVDVFVLAALYTLRLVAGHEATGVEYSDWLLAFSGFFFLNLALVKRFQEVQLMPASDEQLAGRGYLSVD